MGRVKYSNTLGKEHGQSKIQYLVASLEDNEIGDTEGTRSIKDNDITQGDYCEPPSDDDEASCGGSGTGTLE